MAQTKNFTGPCWTSNTLKQSFILLSDHERTEYGLTERVTPSYVREGTDKRRVFTGKPAVRIDDELKALVDLSKKPSDYPYDFVLL